MPSTNPPATPRAIARQGRDLAARMTAAAQGQAEFRAIPESDEDGPGVVIERKRGSQWQYFGWAEDVQETAGRFTCLGRPFV